jgi:hypothetical protein
MPTDVRPYVALLLFVPLSVAVLSSTRQPVRAILLVLFGGLLFLPENAAFDVRLLPPMDKNGFSSVMALTGALLLQRHRLAAVKPLRGVDLFFLIVAIGNIGTAFTNPDILEYGQDFFKDGEQVAMRKVLSPIRPYDIISMTVRDVLGIFVPFYLGRALIRSREDGLVLMRVLVTFGLLYMPLMFIEMRMSPQLHRWIYGYMANAFAHSVRGEGYKPTVFLNNGLPVAMFVVSCIIAAATLLKARRSVFGLPAIVPIFLLWVTLALSRNLGANIYALAAVPLVLLSRGKLARRLATALVVLVCTYPLLRMTDRFPDEKLVNVASKVSSERAHSLNVRFVNEELLMEKARDRVLFGWGGFGRNRIYNERGKDTSITDGEWIIRIGGRGIVGFIGTFGLLLGPILLAGRRMKRIRVVEDRRMLDAMTLLVAINVVDLLPNGLFTNMPFFLAGALAGLAQGLPEQPSNAGSNHPHS